MLHILFHICPLLVKLNVIIPFPKDVGIHAKMFESFYDGLTQQVRLGKEGCKDPANGL